METQCEVCGFVAILPDEDDLPRAPLRFTCHRCGTLHQVSFHVAYCIERAARAPDVRSRRIRGALELEREAPASSGDGALDRVDLASLMSHTDKPASVAPTIGVALLPSDAPAAVPIA